MAIILDYIWQSTFCMLFFYGVYAVFLRNEKNFTFTRTYLLITPLLALVFPLIQIPVEFAKPNISLDQTSFFRALSSLEGPEEVVATFGLPEVTVSSTKLPIPWTWIDSIKVVYLVAVSLGILRIFWSYIQLRLIKERGWYQTRFNLKDNYFFIPTFGIAPVFSYFNKLFWDDSQQLSKKETEQIIKHELIHIRQYHSYDIIYYQVLTIIFWFNPIIHLMKSALVDVHEYLADEGVLKEASMQENYPKLVVKMAFKGVDLPIGNYFIRSTTLKRIIMMKKSNKKNRFKPLMVLPLTGMLLGLVAMKTTPTINFPTESWINKTEDISEQLKQAQDSINFSVKVKKLSNPKHYEWIGPWQGDKLVAQLGELQYEFSDIHSTDDYLKVRGLIQTLRGNSGITKNLDGIKNSNQLDQRAQPLIPLVEWQKSFVDELEIPSKEQELGLLDRLTLELIIDEQGKVNDAYIKNSIGGGLDQQALNLLKQDKFGVWKPALIRDKPVKSAYQVSFFFYPTISDETKASLNFFNPQQNQPDREKKQTVDLSDPTQIFDVVENAPQFEGGMEAWQSYIKENLRYSEAAKRMGIEGTVYLVFVINQDGSVENVELLRGVMSELDNEAIRLVENSPAWIPGSQGGHIVKTRMRLPIRFKLDESIKSNSNLKGQVTKASSTTIQPSSAFNKSLLRTIKYPLEAREKEINGVVNTVLTLDSKGYIKTISITESPSPELRASVMSALGQNKEKWIVDGSKDEYTVELPIVFNLSDARHNIKTGNPYEIMVYGYTGKNSGDAPSNTIELKGTGWSVDANDGIKFSSQKNSPLYVLDGKVVTQEYLNKNVDPKNINAIEVVKPDKASSMLNLYGNGVKNGVVIIETKKN